MKHLVILSTLILTACGSSGGAGGVSTSNVLPQSKRVLYITDQAPNTTLDSDIMPGFGNSNVTIKVAGAFRTYTTLDGTQLAGADDQIAGWLAEDHYDAVVFSLGTVEFNHDVITQPYYYHQNYVGEHSLTFVNALKRSPGVPPLLIYISPAGNGGSASLVNKAGMLGIVSISDGFAFYSGDYQALIASINAKLATALR